MRGRATRTWCLFGLAATAVLSALGWVTLETVRLEVSQQRALEEAGWQESLRIALWRLDSALAPILAQEEGRPYFHYRASIKSRAQDPSLPAAAETDTWVPSPLAAWTPKYFRLHFEISDADVLTSPQGEGKTSAAVAVSWLETLQRKAWVEQLAQVSLPRKVVPQDPPVQVEWNENYQARVNRQTFESQQALSENEYRQREYRRNQMQTLANVGNSGEIAFHAEVEQGPLTPVWVSVPGEGDELFLLRRVAQGSREWRQGMWTDWPALKHWLEGEVRDIFPSANLLPSTIPDGDRSGERERRLALLPVTLDPGSVSAVVEDVGLTPTRVGLLVAWCAVVLALVAVAGVLRASLDLGERRGRFASAVTHELRTPLTTFRLYTQMLADGMVVDPKARQDYLRTLETESERLTRVVESVLLHSRLEDGGVAGSHEVVGIRELLQQVEPSLRARSEASGQTLCVTCDVVPDPLVRVDVQSVEQILFNLTDNVGKYARGAADPRVHLSAGLRGRMVQLRVRDHGPGIPEDVRRHAFQPYRRGREHEGGPAQGVGLGLSVARGLARSLGGDLSLDPDVKEGAGFILSLPRWRP